MRSRLTLAVLLLASLPALSQNFNLQFIGGAVKFGASGMNIVVASNGGGTSGLFQPAPPIPCASTQPVILNGKTPWVVNGMVSGHQWKVTFEFPAPGYNQGKLSQTGLTWELTGTYQMTVTDLATGAVCSKQEAASGEYQFSGPKLTGWPNSCAKPVNRPGQSPGLTGTLDLKGHADVFPIFASGGKCSPALASELNSVIIVNKGFDGMHLEYKLTY